MGLFVLLALLLAFLLFFAVCCAVGFYIKPKRYLLFVAASFPVFIALLIVLVWASAFLSEPYFTTECPQSSDLVGCYTLKSQSVTPGGLSDLQGRPCEIELRADGTFTAANIPPRGLDPPFSNFASALLAGSGSWRIDNLGTSAAFGTNFRKKYHRCWGIKLDSPVAKMHNINLTGQRPPYGLVFVLGDPDSDYTMRLERGVLRGADEVRDDAKGSEKAPAKTANE
jgi:hypothetical protein